MSSCLADEASQMFRLFADALDSPPVHGESVQGRGAALSLEGVQAKPDVGIGSGAITGTQGVALTQECRHVACGSPDAQLTTAKQKMAQTRVEPQLADRAAMRGRDAPGVERAELTEEVTRLGQRSLGGRV
ncbi:MAG: hypothetical protein AAFQ53_17450 [Bacteroidota bacterium]